MENFTTKSIVFCKPQIESNFHILIRTHQTYKIPQIYHINFFSLWKIPTFKVICFLVAKEPQTSKNISAHKKTCFHNFQGLNLNFFQAKLFAHWNLHSILYKVNKPWHFMKFFRFPFFFVFLPFWYSFLVPSSRSLIFL